MRTILLWNDDWRMAGPDRELAAPGWRLTRDRWCAPLADAIVFHLPTLDPATLPAGRRPGQRWVGWSMESAANAPLFADAAFLARFDLTMSHRRDAGVWTPYLPSREELMQPSAPKTERATAVYIASNPRDHNGRTAYVAGLMRHLAVDCWGACLNNRTFAHDEGRATKLATIARYRFTLAFENACERDYVTEKFFHALSTGSVPVVLGAPEIAQYAPDPAAYVDASRYPDPADLAARLASLAADETAYQAMLAWKRTGPGPSLASMLDAVAVDPWTRLARRLADDRDGQGRAGPSRAQRAGV